MHHEPSLLQNSNSLLGWVKKRWLRQTIFILTSPGVSLSPEAGHICIQICMHDMSTAIPAGCREQFATPYWTAPRPAQGPALERRSHPKVPAGHPKQGNFSCSACPSPGWGHRAAPARWDGGGTGQACARGVLDLARWETTNFPSSLTPSLPPPSLNLFLSFSASRPGP